MSIYRRVGRRSTQAERCDAVTTLMEENEGVGDSVVSVEKKNGVWVRLVTMNGQIVEMPTIIRLNNDGSIDTLQGSASFRTGASRKDGIVINDQVVLSSAKHGCVPSTINGKRHVLVSMPDN